jgi:hypothetical protein
MSIIGAVPSGKTNMNSKYAEILSTPEVHDQQLIHYLQSTEFNCCRCLTESKPVNPEGQSFMNRLGTVLCEDCTKPPCSKCKYRSSAVKLIKSTRRIEIENDSQFEALYGFICCNCGRLERVDPEYRKPRTATLVSSLSFRGSRRKPGGFQVNFRACKCKSCDQQCCYECFCFVKGDGIEIVEMSGKADSLERTNSRISTASKMNGKAESIKSTVWTKVRVGGEKIKRAIARVGSVHSERSGIRPSNYVCLTEATTKTRETRHLRIEADSSIQTRAAPEPLACREEQQQLEVTDIAAANILSYMDDWDQYFCDF